MSRIGKLYASLGRQPPPTVSFLEFERLLKAFGFVLKRTRGSHRLYKHPAVAQLLVVQPRGSEAKDYQIRQFLVMVVESELTRED